MTCDGPTLVSAIGMPLFIFAFLSGIALIIWAGSSHKDRNAK